MFVMTIRLWSFNALTSHSQSCPKAPAPVTEVDGSRNMQGPIRLVASRKKAGHRAQAVQSGDDKVTVKVVRTDG